MTSPTEDDWSLLVQRIRDEECVPFLGAGASLGYDGGPSLPTSGELAESLAKECGYPGADRWDLLRVSQYYITVRDRHALRKAIVARLGVRGVKPGAVHTLIADLPFRYVLTTNFDVLMESAFTNAIKQPNVAVYEAHGDKQDLPIPTVDNPLVYKLHGSLNNPRAMVLTEDDVVEFISCLMLQDPPLPASVKAAFQNNSLLFIGYGLKDWNVRVMMRAIRGRRGRDSVRSFAIQKRPMDPGMGSDWDLSVMYFEKHEELRCFNVDALEFLTELKKRYDSGMGKS